MSDYKGPPFTSPKKPYLLSSGNHIQKSCFVVLHCNPKQGPKSLNLLFQMGQGRAFGSLKPNWKLDWNGRSSNRLADELAKWSLKSQSPHSFSTFGLASLPEDFCNIYLSEIAASVV